MEKEVTIPTKPDEIFEIVILSIHIHVVRNEDKRVNFLASLTPLFSTASS